MLAKARGQSKGSRAAIEAVPPPTMKNNRVDKSMGFRLWAYNPSLASFLLKTVAKGKANPRIATLRTVKVVITPTIFKRGEVIVLETVT